MFDSHQFGDALYLEEFLQGEEITITIMPPGDYVIANKTVKKDKHWSLLRVNRFNHQNRIAPYNGTVAVIDNIAVLTDGEIQIPKFKKQ